MGSAGPSWKEEGTLARQGPLGRADNARGQKAPTEYPGGRRQWLHGTEAALVLRSLLHPAWALRDLVTRTGDCRRRGMCSQGIETHTDVEHLTAPTPLCPAQGIALHTTPSPASLVKNRFSSIRMCFCPRQRKHWEASGRVGCKEPGLKLHMGHVGASNHTPRRWDRGFHFISG